MTDSEILAEAIIEHGWYEQGHFKLSSGRESDYYVNLRPGIMDTRYVHHFTGNLMKVLINRIGMQKGDLLCGVITSGLFLSGAMVQRLSTVREVSAIYCRTEHRMHGTRRDIEGDYKKNQPIILIDDVATSGLSLGKVIKILRSHELIVKAALVVVDREEGAMEYLKDNYGVPLFAPLTITRLRAMKVAMEEKDDQD